MPKREKLGKHGILMVYLNVKLQLVRAGRASTLVSLFLPLALQYLFFCEMAVAFSNVPFWVAFIILKNCSEIWLANEVRDGSGALGGV